MNFDFITRKNVTYTCNDTDDINNSILFDNIVFGNLCATVKLTMNARDYIIAILPVHLVPPFKHIYSFARLHRMELSN